MIRRQVASSPDYLQQFYPPQLQCHDPVHQQATLAGVYNPLQEVPLIQQQLALQAQQQQQQHHHHQQQQAHQHHQHQQQQEAAAAAAAAGYYNPNLRLHQHQHQHQHPIPLRPRQTRPPVNMSYAAQPSDEQLADLQKLSAEYEPEVTGPLVGQRQPSTAITSEYATADPVYQQKTAALPQKYSHYRRVRGDGQCGWRAVAFGYFERLISLGDPNKFLEEEARIRSLSNVAVQAGFERYLFEDFESEVIDLMRSLASAGGNADAVLRDAFNNSETQNCMITHIKTLTAAWMKINSGDYVAWMEKSVDQYCNDHILPMSSEIEHIGLNALKDVLLDPASIALEVLYLDRSPGSEVNLHRFNPISNNGFTAATLRLLYRPGHYDILYKHEDLPLPIIPPHQTSVPTFLQFAAHPHHEPAYDLGVSDCMTSIPGMSYANVGHGWMSNNSYGLDFFGTSAPIQQCTQPMPAPVAPPAQPHVQSQPVFVPATPAPLPPPPTQIPQDLSNRAVSHATVPHVGFQAQPAGPFRPSAWELEPDFVLATSQMPFQTNIFKNSHYNTAHFLNPDFQPEEWQPDAEYVTTSNSKGSRHKSCG